MSEKFRINSLQIYKSSQSLAISFFLLQLEPTALYLRCLTITCISQMLYGNFRVGFIFRENEPLWILGVSLRHYSAWSHWKKHDLKNGEYVDFHINRGPSGAVKVAFSYNSQPLNYHVPGENRLGVWRKTLFLLATNLCVCRSIFVWLNHEFRSLCEKWQLCFASLGKTRIWCVVFSLLAK